MDRLTCNEARMVVFEGHCWNHDLRPWELFAGDGNGKEEESVSSYHRKRQIGGIFGSSMWPSADVLTMSLNEKSSERARGMETEERKTKSEDKGRGTKGMKGR